MYFIFIICTYLKEGRSDVIVPGGGATRIFTPVNIAPIMTVLSILDKNCSILFVMLLTDSILL